MENSLKLLLVTFVQVSPGASCISRLRVGENRSDRSGTGPTLLCTEVCELCSDAALTGGEDVRYIMVQLCTTWMTTS